MSFQTCCDELIAQLDFICSQLIHFSDYRKFENETVSMTADMLNGGQSNSGKHNIGWNREYPHGHEGIQGQGQGALASYF